MTTGLSYGTVDCRILVAAPDTPADDDTRPDEISPTGYIYLRARRDAIPDTSASPTPTIVIPDVIPLVIDAEGFASVPDTFGNPTAKRSIDLPALDGMTWTVSFDLTVPAYSWQTGIDRLRVNVASFDIPVEAGQVTHIADYLPLGTDPSSGTTWVKGDRGVGIAGATTSGGKLTLRLDNGENLPPVNLPPSTVPGPAGPANTLKIGAVTAGTTETDASATISGTAPSQTLDLRLPRGPKGNDGAGIPAGGSAGQIPAKTADGGSAWTNANELVGTGGSLAPWDQVRAGKTSQPHRTCKPEDGTVDIGQSIPDRAVPNHMRWTRSTGQTGANGPILLESQDQGIKCEPGQTYTITVKVFSDDLTCGAQLKICEYPNLTGVGTTTSGQTNSGIAKLTPTPQTLTVSHTVTAKGRTIVPMIITTGNLDTRNGTVGIIDWTISTLALPNKGVTMDKLGDDVTKALASKQDVSSALAPVSKNVDALTSRMGGYDAQLTSVQETTPSLEELIFTTSIQSIRNGDNLTAKLTWSANFTPFVAPFPLKVLSVDMMWEVWDCPLNAANYAHVDLRRLHDGTPAQFATKGTEQEAVSPRKVWSYGGAKWNTDNAVFGQGDGLNIAFSFAGTANNMLCPLWITVRYTPL